MNSKIKKFLKKTHTQKTKKKKKMILLFLYHHIYEEKLNYNSLTNYGKEIFKYHYNISTLFISYGIPPNNSCRYVPEGMTLISQTEIIENSLIEWDSYLSINEFYYLSPRTTLSLNLLKSIINTNINFNLNYSYIYINITLIENLIDFSVHIFSKNNPFQNNFLKKKIIKKFIYRSIKKKKNILNNSFTTLKNFKNNIIFEPIPKFCKVIQNSFNSNCLNLNYNFFKNYQKIIILNKSSCSYNYNLKCKNLKWNEFNHHPNRGFIIGPNIIINHFKNTFFGNTVSLLLPTPDFSMIYNAPIIISCFFSCIFAIILRNNFFVIK